MKGKTKPAIEIQPLIDIISLTLQTGFLEDGLSGYSPASLLLIAKPESGKTTAIKEFRHLPFIYYTDEITSKVILEKILPFTQGERPQKRFIMIPDILNSIEKQTYTRLPLINTLKSLTDEGLTKVETPFKYHETLGKNPVKLGFISAITQKGLHAGGQYSVKNDLKRVGFMSRLTPFSYRYPINKIAKILNYIKDEDAKGKYDNKQIKTIKIKTPAKLKRYTRKGEIFEPLIEISKYLGEQSDAYGLRSQQRLQKLAMANAMINDRDEVTEEDVNKIVELSEYMNLEFNLLR